MTIAARARCASAPHGGIPGRGPAGHQRWLIGALLFAATTSNDLDRNALSAADAACNGAGQPPALQPVRLRWTALLRYRGIWPVLLGKLLTDPVWRFFRFWLPAHLERKRGQNPLKSAGRVSLIDPGSSLGSIAGGWLSGRPIQRVSAARLSGAAQALPAATGLRLIGCALLVAGRPQTRSKALDLT